MTNAERHKLLDACYTDTYTYSRSNPRDATVTIVLDQGVTVEIDYCPKHRTGTGEIKHIRASGRALPDKVVEWVDELLVQFAKDLQGEADHTKKELDKILIRVGESLQGDSSS